MHQDRLLHKQENEWYQGLQKAWKEVQFFIAEKFPGMQLVKLKIKYILF